MKITVYLGSSHGNDEKYGRLANDLGVWIALHGHTLVYGGAGLGLMNILAEAVRNNGGKVIGVMPEFMIRSGRNRNDLNELIITEDMASRRKKMLELGDAYIALPGGPGTLEEISEAISASRLRLHRNPCIFVNTDGYYEPLRQQFQMMMEKGFLRREEIADVYFAADLAEIAALLEEPE